MNRVIRCDAGRSGGAKTTGQVRHGTALGAALAAERPDQVDSSDLLPHVEGHAERAEVSISASRSSRAIRGRAESSTVQRAEYPRPTVPCVPNSSPFASISSWGPWLVWSPTGTLDGRPVPGKPMVGTSRRRALRGSTLSRSPWGFRLRLPAPVVPARVCPRPCTCPERPPGFRRHRDPAASGTPSTV